MESPTSESVGDLHRGMGEQAGEGSDHLPGRIALTAAVIAAVAAFTGYLAGQRADEALVDQIRAADYWSQYQTKSIKSAVLTARIDTVAAVTGKGPSEADAEKLAQYEVEMREIGGKAGEKQEASARRLAQRMLLATGVVLFQAAIAIAAVSALTRRKKLWYVSMVFGAAGLLILLKETLVR